MAYKRMVAAALLAMAMTAGSVQAQAPNAGCRKKCDATFSSCTKRGPATSVCLRNWHGCKQQCTATAQARPMQTAAKATAAAPGKARR
ncbi:MAG TPA: hypothetical protein VF699_10145 [Caulobacteraceae bacterium]|jgi:hypothetical protein